MKQTLKSPEEAVVVSIDKGGRVFVDKVEVPPSELKTKLSALFVNRTKKEVFLKADRDVPYGEVVKTMADIKGAGVERLGMVTEPAQRQ